MVSVWTHFLHKITRESEKNILKDHGALRRNAAYAQKSCVRRV